MYWIWYVGVPSNDGWISFKLSMFIVTRRFKFDTFLNDLDFYSRSQGHEKAKMFATAYQVGG